MLDHVEIQTTNLAGAIRFYDAVLAPLGYSMSVDGKAKGFGDGARLDFFLVESATASDVHFAFEAPDREVVDRIYALGREAGLTLDRAPALAPHIHANYYAGYLRDPDGRLVEFVCHKGA
ncbi:MAG: VOC family protein [Hyphomonadaceae bacterium]